MICYNKLNAMKHAVELMLALNMIICSLIPVQMTETTTMTGGTLPVGCNVIGENIWELDNYAISCQGVFPESWAQHEVDERSRDLFISECVFNDIRKQALAGLNLFQLSIVCNYTGRSGQLSIERGTFSQLHGLSELKIKHAGFRSITPGIFCETLHLGTLCLDNNDIVDLADIGLPYGCQAREEPSHSEFSSCELWSLRKLSLSGNSIRILRNDILCKLKQLNELDISHNSLEVIEPNAFAYFAQLDLLNLADNKLKRLSASTVAVHYLENLRTLSLDNNLLSDVESIGAMLKNPKSVTELSLNGNRITHLSSMSFARMTNLRKLNLNYNRISFVDLDTFSSTANMLEVLQLNGNELTNVTFFRNPNAGNYLKYLHLSDNKIKVLDNAPSNCHELIELHLDGNWLTLLDDETFSNLTKLKVLNLSRNKLSNIGNPYDELVSLTQLRLDCNYLGAPGNEFAVMTLVNTPSLTSLNLSSNQIGTNQLMYADVFPNLKELYLSNNNIHHVMIPGFSSLRHIDLSFNKIRQLDPRMRLPRSLEELVFNDNQIEFVQTQTFDRLPRVHKIYLHNNNLKKLDKLKFKSENTELIQLTLRGNPWHCDCTLKWLTDVILRDVWWRYKDVGFMAVLDGDQLTCSREFQKTATIEPMRIIDAVKDKETLLCQFQYTAPSLKQSRPIRKGLCLQTCSCYKNWDWSVVSVDCSSRHLDRIPEMMHLTTHLYLNTNNISKVGTKDFLGLDFVETLDISFNSIDEIEHGTFDCMPKLTNLQLTHNQLGRLHTDLFKNLTKLTTLNMSHNWFESFDESLFTPLRHLRVLDLHHNRLTTYPVWTFSPDRLPYLESISLEENPWSCECDYAMRFADWLTKSEIAIPTRDIQCLLDDDVVIESESDSNDVKHSREISLLAFNASHCFVTSITLHSKTATYLSALIISSCLFLLILSICALTFYYRWELQVLLYHHYGVKLFHKSNDDLDNDEVDKDYDAFVAYTGTDEDFLLTDILPKLEGEGGGYQLCLHHRNFVPGAYITDNILEAIDKSRRTIVLMTPNFVHSEWCRFEFKTAHMQMLKDRRRRLIVIVAGEIPLDDVDNEMKLYLTTNTYLTWGERFFWEKLYFAMPKKPQHIELRENAMVALII